MKKQLRLVHRLITSLLFDPLIVINKWWAIPYFVRNFSSYQRLSQSGAFRIRLNEIFYTTHDRFGGAGIVGGHYFWQDMWAARRIFAGGTKHHVDIGSRIDGFIGHILPFCEVTYVDLRPLRIEIEGLNFKQGSILSLPFGDSTLSSVSSLHVIEHIGLGRYGDPVDPNGYERAAKELARVLAPGGTLLIGTPVGRERLCFDAHRVFDPKTVVEAFSGLNLREFNLIGDKGDDIIPNATFEQGRACEYGCGLFVFGK